MNAIMEHSENSSHLTNLSNNRGSLTLSGAPLSRN